MINLCVLHLVDLLLDDAELLEILGVFPVRNQSADMVLDLIIVVLAGISLFRVGMFLVGRDRQILQDNSCPIFTNISADRIFVLQLDTGSVCASNRKLLVFRFDSHFDKNLSFQL